VKVVELAAEARREPPAATAIKLDFTALACNCNR
jgi:hypothetical protein